METKKLLCSLGINPLNAELNLICHLLALLGAHHILHVGRIRVKEPDRIRKENNLCFVDRASLYNLVNKANLVDNFFS